MKGRKRGRRWWCATTRRQLLLLLPPVLWQPLLSASFLVVVEWLKPKFVDMNDWRGGERELKRRGEMEEDRGEEDCYVSFDGGCERRMHNDVSLVIKERAWCKGMPKRGIFIEMDAWNDWSGLALLLDVVRRTQ